MDGKETQPSRIETIRNASFDWLDPTRLTREEQVALQELYGEWKRQFGLCNDPHDIVSRPLEFDLSETYAARHGSEFYAMVNTVPLDARTLEQFCEQFPRYRDVVQRSREDKYNSLNKPFEPNLRVCFSITGSSQHVYQPDTAKPTRGFAGVLLEKLPKKHLGERKLAYSRFGAVPQENATLENLLEFYFTSLRENVGKGKGRNPLGAVGMHEHLGGLTVALLGGARPEDTAAGGANVLVIYPGDERERAHFREIQEKRLTTDFDSEQMQRGIRTDSLFIFPDIPKNIETLR